MKTTVTIMLDKERKLRLDLNAMAAYQELTGHNLLKGIDFSALTPADYRAFLWVCLGDDGLTQEDVGAMIGSPELLVMSLKKLTELWALSVPTGDTQDPNP